MGLREVLRPSSTTAREVLVRRARNSASGKIEQRLHILDGFLIAYLNLDEVIRIVRFEDEPKAEADRRASSSPTSRPRRSSTCACARCRKLEEMEIGRARQALRRSGAN